MGAGGERSQGPTSGNGHGAARQGPIEASRGEQLFRARTYAAAVGHLHAAAQLAAQADDGRERLNAGLKLADALAHARHDRAALAVYDSALRLAAEWFPNSTDYWWARVSKAQCLRRNNRHDEARLECAAIRSELAAGLLSDSAAQGRICRAARNLEAQILAGQGRFEDAALAALENALEFEARGDRGHAGLVYFNAALWSALATDTAIRSDPLLAQARAALDRARANLIADSHSAADEKLRDADLLAVLVDLVAIKLSGPADAPPSGRIDDLLIAAEAAVDGVAARLDEGDWAGHTDATLLRLRIAERRGDTAAIAICRSRLAGLIARHRPLVADSLQSDLVARFHWHRPVVPLSQPDPELTAFIADLRAVTQ